MRRRNIKLRRRSPDGHKKRKKKHKEQASASSDEHVTLEVEEEVLQTTVAGSTLTEQVRIIYCNVHVTCTTFYNKLQ